VVRPEVCHSAWKEDRYAEEAIQALTVNELDVLRQQEAAAAG
jgi:hypothetical protein